MGTQAKDADPGSVPTLAAVALGLAGLTHTALASQFLMLWALGPFQWTFVVTLLLIGIAATGVAWQLGQGRGWAAIVGVVIAPLLGVMSVGFSAYALWNGTFALYTLFAPPSAALAACLVPFAIGPCRRAERASAELRARYTSGPFASVLDR